MRLVGIIVVFVLTLATIVEGAFLVRLSGQLSDLKEEVSLKGRSAIDEGVSPAQQAAAAASAALAAERLRKAPVPRLETKEAVPAPSAEPTPATEILRGALATEEGRKHLKEALALMKEHDRQADLIQDIENEQQREMKNRERLVQVLGLGPSEQGSIGQLYASLHSSRQRIVDEMRSGLKSAEQADNEIDRLVDSTEKAVESLLGETRVKQLHESRRNERLQRMQLRRQQLGLPVPGAPRPQVVQPPPPAP
jgi:hypothetical protein